MGHCLSTVVCAQSPPDQFDSPLEGTAQWGVRYPFLGHWTLSAYDATGRPIATWETEGHGQAIDLAAHATGIYVLRATEARGASFFSKILRP